MSYNITSVKHKELNLKVPLTFILDKEVMGDIWYKGLKVHNNRFELLFDEDGTEIKGEMIDDKTVKITEFDASSSYFLTTSVPEIITELCKKYKGSVKMTVVWEGGDSVQRIEIKDGNIIKDEEL